MFRQLIPLPLAASFALLALAGCSSVNRVAVNKVADALAGSGTTFASDNDPQLIRDAAPFSLKLMESVLAENPRHAGLLAAACSGFTEYAYAFVQQDADRLAVTDVAAARVQRLRAKGLYLRARDYGLRGLDVAHPGLADGLRAGRTDLLAACTKDDVRLLYWTAAAWGAAVASTKDDARLIADLPAVGALIDRALALDESYDGGAIHAFLVTFEMSRPGRDPAARARAHFDRAVALADGKLVSPYVALAESVCVQEQDRAGFERLLQQALAIDPDARPDARLANVVLQQRARWLLSRVDELFLPAETAPPPSP